MGINDEGNRCINPQNYLVGQDLDKPQTGAFRITFRKIEMEDNDTNFEFYEEIVREIPQFEPRHNTISGEFKEDFTGIDTGLFYEH